MITSRHHTYSNSPGAPRHAPKSPAGTQGVPGAAYPARSPSGYPLGGRGDPEERPYPAGVPRGCGGVPSRSRARRRVPGSPGIP
jgi:hypothetical protein